jgi:hypothetical protein
MASILDGKATAARIKAELRERVAALRARGISRSRRRFSRGTS